jgi:hypothetical protein
LWVLALNGRGEEVKAVDQKVDGGVYFLFDGRYGRYGQYGPDGIDEIDGTEKMNLSFSRA